MSNKTEYSRLLLKRSTIPFEVPTVPTGTTIDNSWLTTDLLVGEGFLNAFDDRLFYRTLNGIIEVPMSGFSSSNFYTESAVLSGTTLIFNRTDTPAAYSVNLSSIAGSGTTGNFLPLNVTANTQVNLTAENLRFIATGASEIESYVLTSGQKKSVLVDNTTASLSNQASDLSTITYFVANNTQAEISYTSPSGTTTIGVEEGMVDIGSSVAGFEGAIYNADYSANFVDRSLVDKEYVDTVKQYINYWEFSGNAVTNIAVIDTYYKLNTSGTTSPFVNGDFNHSNNKVTYTGTTPAICQLEGIISISATNGDEVNVAFFKNGSLYPCSEQTSVMNSGGKSNAVPFHCVLEFNTNDYVEVYVKNDHAHNITLDNVNVIIKEL